MIKNNLFVQKNLSVLSFSYLFRFVLIINLYIFATLKSKKSYFWGS